MCPYIEYPNPIQTCYGSENYRYFTSILIIDPNGPRKNLPEPEKEPIRTKNLLIPIRFKCVGPETSGSEKNRFETNPNAQTPSLLVFMDATFTYIE